MTNPLKHLAALGPSPLGAPILRKSNVPEILRPLLLIKNGFYAFGSSLHVFPWGDARESGEFWNDHNLWLREYGDAVADLIFFAEDAFGFQFAIGEGGILSFDPETAERNLMASNIKEWSSLILDEFEVQTGFPVMHEWQIENGAILQGCRLAPAIPFFLGGKFEAQEMRMKASVELMRFRADIYRQVKDLPDGAQVSIKIEPESSVD